jgi:hypothetical protein
VLSHRRATREEASKCFQALRKHFDHPHLREVLGIFVLRSSLTISYNHSVFIKVRQLHQLIQLLAIIRDLLGQQGFHFGQIQMVQAIDGSINQPICVSISLQNGRFTASSLSCEQNKMNILHLLRRFTVLSQYLIMKLGLCVKLELKVRLLRKALHSLISFDILRDWFGSQIIHNFDLFQEGCVH